MECLSRNTVFQASPVPGMQSTAIHRSSTKKTHRILGETSRVTTTSNLTKRQISRLLQQRLNDPKYLLLCAKEAEDMREHNVTVGHRQRRARIQSSLEAYRNNPLALIRMWEKTCGPGTTKGYTATLLSMHPELKTRKVLDAQDRVRQAAPLTAVKRARPITPSEFRLLLTRAPRQVGLTSIMMLLSASRHMDLLRVVKYQHFIHGIVMLQWANFKSDRYGERAVAKFIAIPHQYLQHLRRLELATYQEVYRELKKISPTLSVHSIRRTAATHLAEAGFSNAEILTLTGHTPTADPHLAVRRYIDPSPNQPESQLQIRMSRTLARIFGLQ